MKKIFDERSKMSFQEVCEYSTQKTPHHPREISMTLHWMRKFDEVR